ncbi:MAG: SDR family oxidoreductase [Myxococcales bacterium]|nr:SDR family oxidoreductase [Myxococcales bacterium]
MPTALITGCSSGFGLLTAVAMAKSGFRVYATLRDLGRGERLEHAARAASVNVEVIQLDVCDPDSIARAVAASQRLAGLDVVVNNAGYGLGGFVHDVDLDEYREQFETNFFGAVAVTKAALPGMIQQRCGRIINVSSLSGRVGMPGLSAYTASKFALEGFTESLRHEVALFGLFASLVEPGTFRTDIFDRNRREARKMRDPSSPYRDAVAQMLQAVDEVLARSNADPQEVAKAIVQAATARRPKLRYLVGRDARTNAVVRGVLPWRWWERLVAKGTHLDRVKV